MFYLLEGFTKVPQNRFIYDATLRELSDISVSWLANFCAIGQAGGTMTAGAATAAAVPTAALLINSRRFIWFSFGQEFFT